MACACLVVGFAGRGPLEYMRHEEDCLLADDVDAPTAADHPGAAIDRFRKGRAAEMQAAAQRIAADYSLEREEARVVQYWTEFFSNQL